MDPLQGPDSLTRAEATCSETGIDSAPYPTDFGKYFKNYIMFYQVAVPHPVGSYVTLIILNKMHTAILESCSASTDFL